MEQKKNKKKIASIVIAATVMIALAAFSMPVSAQGDPGAGCVAETNFYNATIHGGVYFEQDGWALFNEMEKTFDVPSGSIKVARVYTGFWQGSPGKGGFFNITVNAHTTDTYRACDPCPQATGCAPWQSKRCDALSDFDSGNLAYNQDFDRVNMHDYIVGCGVQFVSFNATPYIASGSNTITVKTAPCSTCTRGGWDGRIYLIALLVVYEDPSMPEMTYWINEGALYLEKGSDCDGPDNHLYASKYFNGTHVSNPAKAKLWSLGWPHVINTSDSAEGWTKLNNNILGNPDITESHAGGGYEVLLRWNNISKDYLDPSSNFLEYYDIGPVYERAFAEVFIVPKISNLPDLEVTNIEFPAMMRPDTSYTITATVDNYGDAYADPFNVSLDIEGVPSYPKKQLVSLGLDPGASTTVDFTDVNLAAGCYNFTVVADCDNDVGEGDENNNETTEKRQVGNYIVVRSNSDFDDLVTDGICSKPGDTYICKDLDIENCAGRGIDIQNTNAHFVITNCTVHDCEACGMYFHSVTNGTVNDSVVRDNILKGIRLMNTSYVTIDNNYVHDNLKYGIDVYMAVMPYLDSHHITITNNELTRNLYGIELMGDDCTLRDNLILNTTAYGGGESGWGIYVAGMHNKIDNNTIRYSDSYAMYVDYDRDCLPTYENCIFGNTFVDNLQLISHDSQVYDSSSTHECMNYWNSTVELGYYYGGTGPGNAYDNRTGNNWSDHTCSDLNNDGICDSPYGIDGGTAADYYPLVQPWPDYERVDCGDVDTDHDVDMGDYSRLNAHVTHAEIPVSCEWASDVDSDHDIDMGDYSRLNAHVTHAEIPLFCCKGCED